MTFGMGTHQSIITKLVGTHNFNLFIRALCIRVPILILMQKKGENVIIIFSHSNPTTAKIYSFFRFWFSIREIMLGVVIAGFFYLIILVADQYNQFLKEEQRRKKEKNKH